jgi:hypothetical protein
MDDERRPISRRCLMILIEFLPTCTLTPTTTYELVVSPRQISKATAKKPQLNIACRVELE